MTTEKKTISLFGPGLDHLKTEEGAKRFNDAVEQRNQADFECFQVLRELDDAEMLNEHFFLAGLLRDEYFQSNREEAKEMAAYHAERVREALAKRREADREFSDALMGRSA